MLPKVNKFLFIHKVYNFKWFQTSRIVTVPWYNLSNQCYDIH